MKTLFTAARAILYLTGFLVLWGWIALSVRGCDAQLAIPLPAWSVIPGVMLMIAGGLLGLVCLGTFVVRGKGTAAPFDAPREFVAVGPYRYVRNPMYIGGFTLLAGLGLFERSLSILILSFAALCLVHLFVLFVEERGLEQRFGEGYRDYERSVPRWLPRWP